MVSPRDDSAGRCLQRTETACDSTYSHHHPLGHERSITVVKYNYDGDLLFTASKDHVPSMWAESGERIGTFNGHKGTIWDLDVDRFSTRVLTASADATCRLWECSTGTCIQNFPHRGPVRGVAWADGAQ
eukprot:scaffold244618_cov52-Attheya_sp.AAC.3